MAGELFKAMAGVDILHVPYKGSAGARTDMLGGQVHMMFDAIATMTEHVARGQGEGAGHHRTHALDDLPEVPTVESRACRATRQRSGSA